MKRLLAVFLITISLQSSAQEVTAKERIIQFIEDTYKVSNASAIVDYVFKVSEQKNLDPLRILAIIKVESRFDERAKSPANAHGLMQVHYPSHRKLVVSKNDLYDMETNIDLGTTIWSNCVSKSAKKLALAARCYTGGHQHWLTQVNQEHKKLSKLYKEMI